MLFNNSQQTLVKSLANGIKSATASSKTPLQSLQPQLQFVRGKRTKGAATPNTQRVITQLSVLSAARKQPRLLKLTNEDIVRHQTISNAWSLVQKQKRDSLNEKLAKQYDAVQFAMEDLKLVNGYLFTESNHKEKSKRFSLEMRVPTDFPPNQVWNHNYTKKE